MASRDESKATGAIRKLQEELSAKGLNLGGPGVGSVKFLKCDISSPVSAKAAASEFMARETRLDVLSESRDTRSNPDIDAYLSLVNNAGT